MLVLHIRPYTQVLLKVTNWTADDFVFVGSQRNDGNEAESEKGPARYALRAVIAAVVASSRDAFVAFEVRREVMGAEGNAESHFDWFRLCGPV